MKQKTAQILIATVSTRAATTSNASIHKESTNLSTGFCGYRGIHCSRLHRNCASVANVAARKLAAARDFALQSPAKYPITIRKHVVRHHSGRRLAHLVPAPRLSHRPCPDHRALGFAARQQDHPAAAL